MLILLAIAFQAAGPIAAGKEINCPVVEYGVAPEKLSALNDESSSQADKDLAKTALRDALVKCASNHKWSENRTNAAHARDSYKDAERSYAKNAGPA